MNTSLDSLAPVFKPYVFALLARLTEHRIPVIIVNTLRTNAEQAMALAQGVSWVQHSKHQDGLAIDLVPYHTYILHGPNKAQWDATDPIWLKMCQIAESVSPSIRCGYRWTTHQDVGHYEYAGSSTVGVPA